MGATSSYLTEEALDEYVQLTYLTRVAILQIFDRFSALDPENIRRNLHHRVHCSDILNSFPELKHNPFNDRLFEVFSSRKDRQFSFEDMIDLYSALSDSCPPNVKAQWAFKIFDFDEDGYLGMNDIIEATERLCCSKTDKQSWFEKLTVTSSKSEKSPQLTEEEKNHIASKILADVNLDQTGGITNVEFVHAVMKMPDFSSAFCLKP